ncbi:hypothetical protein BDW74DRAFT_176247 [Aspergillus multicolor]|uniref:DUF3712 domain-containing protein n=1 Tax=Aspergillus multicolor TaxID=41759 RepID=UPI003CCE2952
MASSDKAAVEEIPVGTTAKPSFWTRVKAHYKKWWWAHLIGLIVVVLVVVLPVVYVGYPNIAQSDINDSTLSVESMEISDPTPDGFHLHQRQVIGSDSMFHPKIFEFDADVSLLGGPVFATADVPEVKADDGAVVVVDQWLNLTDAGAFGDFAQAVMLNEEFKMNIYGEPRLKQGGLPTIDIDYNKTVTMKGLNKLDGFKIVSLTPVDDRDDGNTAEGTVYIPNPSVLQLDMGNLTLDVSLQNGTVLGQSFLNDLVLKPGNNTVPMLANMDMSAFFSMVLAGQREIPLRIVGNSSVYNGKEIPYFTQALAANVLTTTLNLTEVLS